jgi:hypothetical protein
MSIKSHFELVSLSDIQDAQSVLKTNSLITIRHFRIFEPLIATIQKIEGANIYFGLPQAFTQNGVLVGDPLTCSFIVDDSQYVIYGNISSIDLLYPPMVCLIINDLHRYKNNRQFKRYYVSFPTQVSVPGTSVKVYGIVTNISQKGAAAIFNEPLTQETVKLQSLVRMNLGDSTDEFLEFKARIIRTEATDVLHEYGLEIVQIEGQNEQKLKSILAQLEQNENLFIDKSLK